MSEAAAPNHPPIVVCDMEFTGHGRDRTQSKVFAVALVLLHPAKCNEPIPETDKLVVYIDHEGIHDPAHPMWTELKGKEFWNAPAQAEVRKHLLEKVKSEGMKPELAFGKVWAWLSDKARAHPDLTLLDDGGADWDLLNHCLAKHDAGLTVQYIRWAEYTPYFDFNSYCKGLARTTWAGPWWGNTDAALKALGLKLPEWKVPHDHNPLNDAERFARTAGFVIHHIVSLAASESENKKRKTDSPAGEQ